MSGAKSDIKTEEEDPANLSVQDKVRRLSNVSDTGISTPKPNPKMEECKARLDVKRKLVEGEFRQLEHSLKTVDPDPRELKTDISFLKRQVSELVEVQNKYMNFLIKDNREQYEVEAQNQFLLQKRLSTCEVQIEELLLADETSGSSETSTALMKTEPRVLSTVIMKMCAQLSSITNDLLEKVKSPLSDKEHVQNQMELFTERLPELLGFYDAYMESLLFEGNADEFATQSAEKSEWIARKRELEKAISKLWPSDIPVPVSTTTATPAKEHHRVKLPKRELVKFGGDVRDWLSFCACFKDIDTDPHLTTMDKFHLLLQSMMEGSPAQKLVRSYPVSAENYTEVLNCLKERYGRDNVLVKVYVRDLLRLVVENSAGKKLEFSDLVNQVTSQIRNLATLGVTQDKCAQVLYPVVESCLPDHVLTAWQRSNSFKEELDPLLTFLKDEVNNHSERQLARSQFGSLASTPKSESRSEKQVKTGRDASRKSVSFASPPATASALVATEDSSDKKRCIFCDKPHHSIYCKKALSWTYGSRKAVVLAKRCCLTCLRPGHISSVCKVTPTCSLCSDKHHLIMCFRANNDDSKTSRPQTRDDKQDAQSASPDKSAEMCNQTRAPEVPLQTLITTAFGMDGKKARVRVFFDSGSQRSYITSKLLRELQLRLVGNEEVIHDLFGGSQSPSQKHEIAKLYIGNYDGSHNCGFDVRVIDRISNQIISPRMGPWIEEFEKMGIHFSDLDSKTKCVDVLVGNDVRARIFTGERRVLESGLVAEKTLWGWVLSGKLPCLSPPRTSSNTVISMTTLDRPLSDLWSLDAIGIHDATEVQTRKEMEEQSQLHFSKTVTRLEDGRYEVALPWLSSMQERLPDNYYAALRRLKTTSTALKKSGYLEQYHDVFQEWKSLSMIESVPNGEEDSHEGAFYLPHRAVVKPSSVSTPLRPVFDASAKGRGQLSLNECVDKGVNTLELIPTILTRFRLYQEGAVADIRKAFQQISVREEDRDYLRFLWWEDPSCLKVMAYRHTRVVFGVSCSPFLLGATLNHHLKNPNDERYSETAARLLRSMYVDNCVTSLPNRAAAINFQKEAEELLLPAKFDLRGWEYGPSSDNRDVSVLGLLWNLKRDDLTIDVTSAMTRFQGDHASTQRRVLAYAHMLYDPLGMISPFILLAKLLLRRCHDHKLGWDTPLPPELEDDFGKWKIQIPQLVGVRVPRYTYFGGAESYSLHVFCDASSLGYAVVILLRVNLGNRVRVSLVQSKAKVTPKKKCTIPRLELIACTIASRLLQTVLEDMDHPTIPITMWSDSSTALAWIAGAGPWGVFVQNRKLEINSLTETCWWRHVPGKLNPADLPSRGCSAAKLVESRWWEGPAWLYQPEDSWPMSCEKADLEAVESEMRKTVVNCVVVSESHPCSLLKRMSSYPKILRVLAYCLRFVRRIRTKANLNSGRVPETITRLAQPSLEELQQAQIVLLRFVQLELHSQPERTKRLRPYVDNDGIMRTKTRLIHDDDENFLCPIILPDRNDVVRTLIRWEHENTCHAGTEMLLSHLRERYWILNGRRTVRKVVHSCWICKRFLARAVQVPEAPLPIARTELREPFEVVGVDAAGPLILKTKQKVWILLFTCATYRAVHIEVVDTLSTAGFLRAFRQFVARCARPRIIYSDNGLNFVGANAAIQKVDWSRVLEYATVQRIEWRFNSPTASWWGGFFERMIGLVKALLKRVLGKRVVHLDELVTLMTEVEAAVNSRPLTHLSDNCEDPQPLTPLNFVRNKGLAVLPEADVLDGKALRAAHRKLQHLREALRTRFRKEYLGQLLHHHHNKGGIKLQPGDVVLVQHENQKRQDWPLAVVNEAIPGKDGVARVFRLRTSGGEILRPAQRLFPLETLEV